MQHKHCLTDQSFMVSHGLGDRVKAMTTMRFGGVSLPPFDSLNLGGHVGDHSDAVLANRALLKDHMPSEPHWLNQVHGIRVYDADCDSLNQNALITADASVTTQSDRVLGVLTADCMPVVLSSMNSEVLAIAHAGWRGLADGILSNTIQAMQEKARTPITISAWIGPCIGAQAFQVGGEVRQRFMELNPLLDSYFVIDVSAQDKWLADLPGIASWELHRLGVTQVQWCGVCTVKDPLARFYSYRRDGQTGRMATLAWIVSQ